MALTMNDIYEILKNEGGRTPSEKAMEVAKDYPEKIAIREARKLKIPIFAMVDTNSDPKDIDFLIPSNDDATKSIEKIFSIISKSIEEGLNQRKKEKEEQEQIKAKESEEKVKDQEKDNDVQKNLQKKKNPKDN